MNNGEIRLVAVRVQALEALCIEQCKEKLSLEKQQETHIVCKEAK